jgi:hypothetical protein
MNLDNIRSLFCGDVSVCVMLLSTAIGGSGTSISAVQLVMSSFILHSPTQHMDAYLVSPDKTGARAGAAGYHDTFLRRILKSRSWSEIAVKMFRKKD